MTLSFELADSNALTQQMAQYTEVPEKSCTRSFVSLASSLFFLAVVFCPLELARVSSKYQGAFSAFA